VADARSDDANVGPIVNSAVLIQLATPAAMRHAAQLVALFGSTAAEQGPESSAVPLTK
jgi:hypothetical protein